MILGTARTEASYVLGAHYSKPRLKLLYKTIIDAVLIPWCGRFLRYHSHKQAIGPSSPFAKQLHKTDCTRLTSISATHAHTVPVGRGKPGAMINTARLLGRERPSPRFKRPSCFNKEDVDRRGAPGRCCGYWGKPETSYLLFFSL